MVIRSPFEDVELAEGSLTAYVFADAGTRADKPALIDGVTGRALSYRELTAQVEQAAAGLIAHGVAKGDVLALCSPNCPEFVVACYAAASAGAVITPINPLATREDMTGQLAHSHARWLITTAMLFEEKGRTAASAAGIRDSFVFGQADGAARFRSLLEASRAPAAAAVSPDDLALLPYSSGTTGLPKGVVLSHRNLVANLCQTRAAHRVRAADVVIAALPLFHIYGMQVTLNLALREGATVVTMPRFGLEMFLRLVQDYRVSRADLVPPIVLALATQPVVNDYDLSSLQVVTSGAAPLGTDVAQACARRLGCRVKQAYGMTELGGATHCAPDTGREDPGSIGPSLPDVECRIVDCLSGADAGPGQPGELLIRTPGQMRCYLGNPAATAVTVDPDGWVHTGDIASADTHGWFRIVDRLKDLIKYNGHQVAPAELESVLLAHPAVTDAAVIGSPDHRAGEVPKAFVVLRSPASREELLSFVADRVAPYKKIRLIEFAEAIPRSPSGKILRRILAGQEHAARSRLITAAH